MATYTIKDLEKLSGIKAHTLRIWEKRYGLIEPRRTSTNIRTYCDPDLRKLLNITLLNRNGIKISRIAKLSQDEIIDKINHFLQNSTDTESQIESLAIAMIDMNEGKFEKILSKSIIQYGFEETVIKIIYPFFRRVGIMWQTGTVNPAQEHFVSNLIRQKLIVAIDSQLSIASATQKSFLLFLPEGELHELGLLFFAYLIKKRGHKVTYLGQSVPINDLAEIQRLRPFDYLVTAFVSSMHDNGVLDSINTLAAKFSGKTIFISGEQTEDVNGELPLNIKIISSPLEFINELDRLPVN